MNLISSYKTEFELLRKFIEEEEERKETEKVAEKKQNFFERLQLQYKLQVISKTTSESMYNLDIT